MTDTHTPAPPLVAEADRLRAECSRLGAARDAEQRKVAALVAALREIARIPNVSRRVYYAARAALATAGEAQT